MLKIYNSLTDKKEIFESIHPNQVNLYVCGMTVYDYCHIGHARSMIVFDMVVRYLKELGYQVNYIRNITDVDDKIIKRAEENNESIDQLTERFIQAMNEDTESLGLLKPTHEPKATLHIQEMIDLISQLLTNNAAYIAENGDVYFNVRAIAEYGQLSRSNLEKLKAAVRIDINHLKKDPLDFILWKISKPGEPSWPSPWGMGRPGWHTECSAMSTHYLGQPFDIHGGGLDLKFPHHDNEIAQAEAAFHKNFANVWMHSGLLQVNNEKMSKSLGNYFTIRDVLKEYDVETLRYFFLASHYSSPVNYTIENLVQARNSLNRLYLTLLNLNDLENDMDIELTDLSNPNPYYKKFIEAMDDDFNTPIAIAVLFDIAHEIQRLYQQNNIKQAAKLGGLLKHCGRIFNILQKDPKIFTQGQLSTEQKIEIDNLVVEREQARSSKDWQRADQIRDQLQTMGIVIEDSVRGTRWRVE